MESGAEVNAVALFEPEGVEVDSAIALSTLRSCQKSAEQGHTDGIFCLSMLYNRGVAVKQNDDEALRWLRKAAEAGDPDAQNSLGESYQGRGSGVSVHGFTLVTFVVNAKQDYAEALKWYQRAAAQGFASAQSNLGCA